MRGGLGLLLASCVLMMGCRHAEGRIEPARAITVPVAANIPETPAADSKTTESDPPVWHSGDGQMECRANGEVQVLYVRRQLYEERLAVQVTQIRMEMSAHLSRGLNHLYCGKFHLASREFAAIIEKGRWAPDGEFEAYIHAAEYFLDAARK